MTFIYYESGSPSTFQLSGQQMLNGFQAQLNQLFYDAPDTYVIQEETPLASGTFVNADVRINIAINSQTGTNLGDDFKNIIFKDLQHSTGLGYKYFFDNNYWLVINSEIYKNFAASCTVRRCNNTLRWIDENGVYYTEPCIVDYDLASPKDYNRVEPVKPDGTITVYSQFNVQTKKIKPNMRFLFGNPDLWIGYKIYGNGIQNYLNYQTLDNTSAPLLMFKMNANFEGQENDDLVLGIANANQFIYDLSVVPSSISGNVGETFEIIPTLNLNGIPVARDMSYISSGSQATLTDNIVSLVSSGSCNISVSMTDNPLVTEDIPVVISTTPIDNYEIRVTPNLDYIFDGDIQVYSVYLYYNGVQQSDAFVFSIANDDVPVENYLFTVINDNSFSIGNIDYYISSPLKIDLTSGTNTRQISILLKGAW